MHKKETNKEQVELQSENNFDWFTTPNFVKSFKLNLDLAGIYFVNAYMQIKQGEKEFKRLEKEIVKYHASYKRRAKKFGIESEDFITYQLHKLRDIEVYYEPVVRNFATAKILLSCCAEAYVNEVANSVLTGSKFDEFDKLSLSGKWIFIQDIMKLKKLITVDKNPLQGFVQLIKERNKLVHFKGRKKELQLLEIPNYLEDFNLTPSDCNRNLENVRELIMRFSLNWIGSYGPDWLNVDDRGLYRNPCFFLGNREIANVLYSDKNDKKRMEEKSINGNYT
jgi:hypothetical protein